METSQVREDDSVQRRAFVGLTAAAMFGAFPSDNEPTSPVTADTVEDLAAALTGRSAPVVVVPTLASLTATVTQAKQDYQACRYGDVLTALPVLLRSLRAACTSLNGDNQRRAHALTAEACHVAASVMLKHEDKGLAWLAADRSVHAAQLSEVPLMIGSSARIITHAVLLLRGAIAAAQYGDGHTVTELLDEAEQAGHRLGHEGNHMWTAFGPDNVLCHRVNAALAMGNAGTAIAYARQVNIDALPINERKAALLLDAARAFLMWGKHERALKVLRAAGQIAPEEITGRPATRRFVGDLATTAPVTVRREVREFADALGVAA
jgi:hypothetical protein